jgi:glycerophosphoryl diester phosphodiesterase
MTGSALAADKIVIAHRGASGYLPEHTLPAKAMAYAGRGLPGAGSGDDKDDQLVVLHDHYLDRVTDVANVSRSARVKMGAITPLTSRWRNPLAEVYRRL